jgi:hypothetical protein
MTHARQNHICAQPMNTWAEVCRQCAETKSDSLNQRALTEWLLLTSRRQLKGSDDEALSKKLSCYSPCLPDERHIHALERHAEKGVVSCCPQSCA